MSKQKKGLVPELRFSEFEKEPNWPCVQLNAVAKRSTSKNKGEKVTRVLTNSAVDGVVDQRDYFEKDIAVKGNLESYYIVDEGDYVYNPRISSAAPVGPISKNKVGKGVMSPLYTVFNFNSRKNDFFEQYFRSSRWHGYLQTISNSGARHDRMSITSSEFMAMPVPNPGDMEQQKIADCLASIDELIALHAQKLDSLKDHKKGLMQQLFPAEGETVPKLRFPEFRCSPRWEKKSFNKVFKRITTKNKENNSNVLTISAQKGLVSQLDYFNKSVSAKDVTGYYLLEKGDFAYNKSYSQGYPMGAIKPLKFYDKGVVSTLYICFKANKGYDVDFFEYYFDSGMHNFEISQYAQEGARNHGLLNIGVNDFFEGTSVTLPGINEQKRIAEFLSSIDDLIDAQVQKITLLKDQTKGLMQKLFPVTDDVVS